jgi:hypothetical protein
MPNTLTARYHAAIRHTGGDCPIEAGLLGSLADHECAHGRLPADRTPTCGCWPQEDGVVIALSAPTRRPDPARRAA